jgi:hypothetical protein
MAVQLVGNSGTIADVDSTTNRALRAVLRPNDPGALGQYKFALQNGLMVAGLAANSPIVSFRYGGAAVCTLRRITFSAGVNTTAFALGAAQFDLFAARSFTASDSGGTAANLSGNNAKLRTAYASSALADFRCSSTATLTAGTRTLDAQGWASLVRSIAATTALDIVNPETEIFKALPGDQRGVFVTNEGFVIQASVPATGTWNFTVGVEYDELASW